jgi:hypothetical protein
MNNELKEKLYQKYPEIFADKDKSARESCMYWGIACPDGWYTIIEKLCAQLQHDTNINNYPQVVAEQVKEKFGTMRFYYRLEYTENSKTCNFKDFREGFIAGMIASSESRCSEICAICGSNQSIKSKKGWVQYLCENCMEAENEKT